MSTKQLAATAAVLALTGSGVSIGVASAQPTTGPLPGPAPTPTSESATAAPALPAEAPETGAAPEAPQFAAAAPPADAASPRGRLPGPAPAAEAPGDPGAAVDLGSPAMPDVPALPVAAPSPDAKTVIDTDGEYTVNSQIVPGTYVSAGPVEGDVCYWKRLGNGEHSNVIDNAMTKKPQTIAIEATDSLFRTSGCQTWQRSDTAKPQQPLPPMLQGLQLRQWINNLDNNARQSGNGALPPR